MRNIVLIGIVFTFIYFKMLWSLFNKEELTQRVSLNPMMVVGITLAQGHGARFGHNRGAAIQPERLNQLGPTGADEAGIQTVHSPGELPWRIESPQV